MVTRYHSLPFDGSDGQTPSRSSIGKHTHAISYQHVQEAIKKLKSGKSDCEINYINGSPRLFIIYLYYLHVC